MTKYDIIYADPPWQYTQKTARGGTAKHYKTMSLEELKAMKPYIDEIAAENCALFMWYTGPQLKVMAELVEAWDFEYINNVFVWVKRSPNGRYFTGNGNYTRGNAEYCALARRGEIRAVRHDLSQMVETIVLKKKHSKKPIRVRDLIVMLMGDLPRIELFAREQAEGWDWHGNDKKLTVRKPLDDYIKTYNTKRSKNNNA